MTVPTQATGSRAEFATADFAWYGLDESFAGPRRLHQLCRDSAGLIEYGLLAHGDTTGRRPDDETTPRFVTVLTMPARPRRASGNGYLEATSVSAAACVAGVGLLADNWPWKLERELRQDWLDQQSELAWELANDLSSDAWQDLSLPVDDRPLVFRYRESEYGWVLAGAAEGVFLGAYGLGISAYGLALTTVTDLGLYAEA